MQYCSQYDAYRYVQGIRCMWSGGGEVSLNEGRREGVKRGRGKGEGWRKIWGKG